MNETALKERIRAIATEKEISFNECWKRLLLERFLARVAASEFTDHLVFKGGSLLSYSMEFSRETMDLDFLLTKIKAESEDVTKTFEAIAKIDCKDNFVFTFDRLEVLDQPRGRLCPPPRFERSRQHRLLSPRLVRKSGR